MFLLLGTDLSGSRRPVITEALIILMMLAYLLVLVIGVIDQELATRIVSSMALSSTDMQWWQAITYQFAHDNPLLEGTEHPLWRLLHLGGNLMCLWVFGAAVESRMGLMGFSVFALLGGAVAGLLHAASSPAPVIGASGMVGALAGAFLVLAPMCRVKVLIIFILIRIWWIPALWVIGIWIAMDLAGWAGLTGGNTAYVAHLGGYLWGATTALALLPTPAIRRSDQDLPALLHRRRRRNEWKQTIHASPAQRRAAEKKDRPPPFLAELRSAIRNEDANQAANILTEQVTESSDITLTEPDQLALANLLQANGHRALAAEAYQRYLTRWSSSAQATEVRLLLGLLLVRSLNKPDQAIPLLKQVMAERLDDSRRSLAERLLQEAAT